MILLFLLCIGIISGDFGSISISDTVRLSFLDIAVFISFVYALFHNRQIIPILKKDRISQSFLLFLLIALVSLILTPLSLTPLQSVTSFLYILRLLIYFSVYPTLQFLALEKKIRNEDIYKTVVVSGIALSVIGWLQYFLYPDLRNLYYLGWDPHYKRIFSTFLDPNFLGIYLVICLSIFFNYRIKIKKDHLMKYSAVFVLLITIFFTYSRSSLASLLILGIIYIWKRGKRILFVPIIAVFMLGLFFLPRPGGEGVNLIRLFSISQRLDHARLGLSLFFSHPVLGIGFDALRYAKAGLENPDMWLVSHAGAGLDISLLFVLATTGIVGFLFFVRFLYVAFREVPYNIKLILMLILFHSLFENSFFFPFVFLGLWMLFAAI